MGFYDELKNSTTTVHGIAAKIMVIGVGGAGGNAVDHIYDLGIKGVNLMICNTDIKALAKSPLSDSQKICMGDGKGAGNDAEQGREKATKALPEIRDYIESHNPDMVFITAGMGGGTGTGATPVIAEMIHALDIPTIAIMTTPPLNEGMHRFEQATRGIESMKNFVDTFIVIKNEIIIETYPELSVKDAFNKANDVVAYAAKGIAEIALTQSDLVSVDISDVCKVVRHSHCAVMGMASANGTQRAIKAIDKAILSPLFGGAPITGATDVLVNFATSSSDGLIMKEVNEAIDHIQDMARYVDQRGVEQAANIIWGTSVKPELGDDLEIIVVVAGFPADSFYSSAFGGKLNLGVTPQAPQQIVEPINEEQVEQVEKVVVAPQEIIEPPKPAVEQPAPSKPVNATPVQKVVPPTQPKTAPVQPKTVPAQPRVVPVQPQPNADVSTEEEEVYGNEPWRVVMPPRQGVRTIPISQCIHAQIINSKRKPAYVTRRMMLIAEVVGKSRKVVGKTDEDVQTSNEIVDGTSQSIFDF